MDRSELQRAKIAAEEGTVVTVQYVGVSLSSGEEFDSSWDNGSGQAQ